jgi:hypothetical protein
VAELPVLVKADVQGSAEAIVQALEKVGNDEVRVRVLHSGVGAITDSDVGWPRPRRRRSSGSTSAPMPRPAVGANQKGVEIRYYSIIYDLVDDIKAAASGLLKAEVRENFIGYAEILQVFKVSGVGKVAGCLVTEGVARRSAGVRLLRDNVVIHEGTLKTLKRFKDEVKEVSLGPGMRHGLRELRRCPRKATSSRSSSGVTASRAGSGSGAGRPGASDSRATGSGRPRRAPGLRSRPTVPCQRRQAKSGISRWNSG